MKKDWQRLFKSESIPKIVGVGVFTDSDGTRTAVTGWYDDILIEGRQQLRGYLPTLRPCSPRRKGI